LPAHYDRTLRDTASGQAHFCAVSKPLEQPGCEPSRLQLIAGGSLAGHVKKGVAVKARRQNQPRGGRTIQAADQLTEGEYGKSRRHAVDGRAID
jgi:hypothetical protein